MRNLKGCEIVERISRICADTAVCCFGQARPLKRGLYALHHVRLHVGKLQLQLLPHNPPWNPAVVPSPPHVPLVTRKGGSAPKVPPLGHLDSTGACACMRVLISQIAGDTHVQAVGMALCIDQMCLACTGTRLDIVGCGIPHL